MTEAWHNRNIERTRLAPVTGKSEAGGEFCFRLRWRQGFKLCAQDPPSPRGSSSFQAGLILRQPFSL